MINTYVMTMFVPSAGPSIEMLVGPVEYILRNDQRIYGYWNYIPLVYCFKSDLNASYWAVRFRAAMQGGNYTIMKIDASDINGQLPGQAWDWFYAPPNTSRQQLTNLGMLPPPQQG